MKTKILLFAALCVACYAAETREMPGDKQPAITGSISMSNGFHQYKQGKDADGKDVWVINEEAENSMAKWEARKSELVKAVVSRVLTESEMTDFVNYGSHIFVHNMEGFYEKDVNDRFNAAIVQQYKLRALAAPVASVADSIVITTQESADVVRAMGILESASRPRSENMGFMSSYSTDLVYRPNGFSAEEKAAMAREEAAFYEAKAKAESEQYERLQWARSILELWKKKVEGAK